jgi:hypothetical protein
MIYKDYSPQAIVARKRYKRKLKIARVKQTLKELCIMTLFVFIVATNWVDVLLDKIGS